MSCPAPDDQVGGFLPSPGESRIVVGSAEVFPMYGCVFYVLPAMLSKQWPSNRTLQTVACVGMSSTSCTRLRRSSFEIESLDMNLGYGKHGGCEGVGRKPLAANDRSLQITENREEFCTVQARRLPK